MKFTKTHEWMTEEDGIVTVGITDYAQNEMGDIVYVELPELGKTLVAGGDACELESVKAVAPVLSPVGGEVVEVNSALDDDPAVINREPLASWLFKVKAQGPAEDCMTQDEYDAYLKTL